MRECIACNREHGGIEQARAAKVQHHLRHGASEEHLHGSKVGRARWGARRRGAAPRGWRTPSLHAPGGEGRQRGQSPECAAADWSIHRTPRESPWRCERQHRSECRACRAQAAPVEAERARNVRRPPARWADQTARAQYAAATAPTLRRPPATSQPCRETGNHRPGSHTRGSQRRRRTPA